MANIKGKNADGNDVFLKASGAGTDLDPHVSEVLANLSGTDNAVLDNIQTALEGTLTVDAAALPLPTGASTSANQTTLIGHVDGIETLLGTIDTDTSALAGTVSGTELQVDIVAALPAGDNNIGNIDVATIPQIGATDDAAATSNTGTFSLISLVKRIISRIFASRTLLTTTVGTTGDSTLIAAPSAGQRLVISGLRVQNATSTATSVLFKGGASNIFRVRSASDSGGLSENYGLGDEIRLPEASALVVNQSGANSHEYSIRYWIESTSTGLPI
jgi:hypothetical protein